MEVSTIRSRKHHWNKLIYILVALLVEHEVCADSSEIDDYDIYSNYNFSTLQNLTEVHSYKDIFTLTQRLHGAVILHILGVIYMFVAIAIVCIQYLVPCLTKIAEKFNMTKNVAGATIIAAGFSLPKFFASIYGIFVSFSDVGVGIVVGSSMFNILIIIGVCALFSKTILTLSCWPLFRDIIFYGFSIVMSIWVFRDNIIFWWETLLLLLIYLLYLILMKWNEEIMGLMCKNEQIKASGQAAINNPENSMDPAIKLEDLETASKFSTEPNINQVNLRISDIGLKTWPSWMENKVTYFLVLPITSLLRLTLPDARKGLTFFIITLIGSILWIAVFTYLLIWCSELVGETFSIPSEICGLTYLAVGFSIPNLLMSVYTTKIGLGDVAASCSFGINLIDFTVVLPLPWLLYGMIYEEPFYISSEGMVCLLTVIFIMLLLFMASTACCRLKIGKTFGAIMIKLYILFIVLSISFEYEYIVCPY